MVFVGIGHAVIAAKLLIGFVICIQAIPAATVQPALRGLDAEMVVLFLCQSAFAVAAFQYALRQCHGGRYSVAAHLLHRTFGVLLRIYFVLAFTHI